MSTEGTAATLEPPRKAVTKGSIPSWSPSELRLLAHKLSSDHLAFCRYFMKYREGIKFMINPHHRVLSDTLQKVYDGEITRLIINIPPGYTKTEMAVINFIARGLAINPRSRYIHISYADSLALINSTSVRDIVSSEGFCQLWPTKIRLDQSAKKAWFTESGGGVLAVASGGTITGFRAGRMEDGFSGAMIIDDPIKPEDSHSDTIRERINGRFNSTFKSRLAHENIPIIVIMQRVHPNDPTSFLLEGGSGEEWHHLNLPVEIPESGKAVVNPLHTHSIPIEYDLEPGPLWTYKHTAEQIELLKSDMFTFMSQYMQSPISRGGKFFSIDKISVEHPTENMKSIMRYWDKAGTSGAGAYTVGVKMGIGESGRIWVLDVIRGQWDSNEREEIIRKAAERDGFKCRIGIEQEPGSGGKESAQNTVRNLLGFLISVERPTGDKSQRADAFSVQVNAGNVTIVPGAWNKTYLTELQYFPNSRFKDQVDASSGAFNNMVLGRKKKAGVLE